MLQATLDTLRKAMQETQIMCAVMLDTKVCSRRVPHASTAASAMLCTQACWHCCKSQIVTAT